MLVSVIPIGNSRGIRLPKAILEQLHIEDTLEMEVEEKQLILKPVSRPPRGGWEIALRSMNTNSEDSLILKDSHEIEAFEWEW